MHTITPSVLLALLVLTGPSLADYAAHHSVVITRGDGTVVPLRPTCHEVDVDILGFVAEVSIWETYRLDTTTVGQVVVACADTDLLEVLSLAVSVDSTGTATRGRRDTAGVTIVAGPHMTGPAEVTVELRYAQLLPRSHGLYTFTHRFPETEPPAEGRATNARAGTWLAATLSSGMPIRDFGSPTHTTEIWYEGDSRARAVPDLSDDDTRTFVLEYSLDGEEIIDEFFELETPEGEVMFMVVE